MANFNSAFQDALADQAKAALCEAVARQPKTTIMEIAELVAWSPALGTITLAELLAGLSGRRRPGRPRKNPLPLAGAPTGKGKGSTKPKAGKRRNTRTPGGRDRFDSEVLAALREAGGQDVRASALREMIGTDPIQLRAALNRMIEQGLVTFSGRAKGTRYSVA